MKAGSPWMQPRSSAEAAVGLMVDNRVVLRTQRIPALAIYTD